VPQLQSSQLEASITCCCCCRRRLACSSCCWAASVVPSMVGSGCQGQLASNLGCVNLQSTAARQHTISTCCKHSTYTCPAHHSCWTASHSTTTHHLGNHIMHGQGGHDRCCWSRDLLIRTCCRVKDNGLTQLTLRVSGVAVAAAGAAAARP